MVALMREEVATNIERMYASFPGLREKRNGWHEHRESPKFDCREREDGTIEIHSWTGRTGTQILAMGNPPLTWSDIGGKDKGSASRYQRRDKLDLMELAHHLKLDWQYLFSLGYSDGYSYTNQKLGITQVCVKIGGYCRPGGTEHSKHQLRLSTAGKRRFLWNENTPGEVIPCGLHRLHEAREAGYLMIGEGSSDTAVMWWHGFSFLGLGVCVSAEPKRT
jgi:hypothetical protein